MEAVLSTSFQKCIHLRRVVNIYTKMNCLSLMNNTGLLVFSMSIWTFKGASFMQVYKRKTEAAKKEYLKALAAYKDNQECQVRGLG